jgi:hypothetical protein
MFIDTLKLVIGPLAGAALALIGNRLFDAIAKKPKLIFSIRKAFDVSPESEGIKFNPSGYELLCENIGQVPVFIDEVSVYYKGLKKDCFSIAFPGSEDEISAVMPFIPVTYSITNQDYKGIIHLCRENKKYKCKLIAYSNNKKKYKYKLDLWWIGTEDFTLSDDYS